MAATAEILVICMQEGGFALAGGIGASNILNGSEFDSGQRRRVRKRANLWHEYDESSSGRGGHDFDVGFRVKHRLDGFPSVGCALHDFACRCGAFRFVSDCQNAGEGNPGVRYGTETSRRCQPTRNAALNWRHKHHIDGEHTGSFPPGSPYNPNRKVSGLPNHRMQRGTHDGADSNRLGAPRPNRIWPKGLLLMFDAASQGVIVQRAVQRIRQRC